MTPNSTSRTITPWQRFWLMFAGVFLASTFAVTAAVWPMRDQAVVDAINAPACKRVGDQRSK